MPRIAGLRGPGLERMLSKLPRLRQLAYRLALSQLSPHCRGDPYWRARIDELRAGLSRDDMAAALADAEAVVRQLMDEMD
jgi:hypothetical protein